MRVSDDVFGVSPVKLLWLHTRPMFLMHERLGEATIETILASSRT